MPKAPPITRMGFTRGAMPSVDPSVVPENALWRSRNVKLDQSGVLRIRKGYDPFTNDLGTGHVQGISSFLDGFVAVHDRNVYYIDPTGSPDLLLSDSLGKNAKSEVDVEPWEHEGSPIAYLFGGNGIYWSDGTDEGTELVEPYEPQSGEAGNLLRDEGTGEQDVTSGPAGCTEVLLRPSIGVSLYATCNPKFPNTVYRSSPGRGDYWPNDQWFNLPEGQAKITALALWYNALLVFRDYDIWAYFKTDEVVDEVNPGSILQEPSIGCVARRSVVAVPGLGIIFVGGPQGVADNVYVIRHVQAIENQVKAEPIGDDIRIDLLEAIRRYGTEGISATYFDGEYRLSVPANLGESRVYRLDVRNQSGWMIDHAPRTTQFVIRPDGLYGAMWNEGRLIKFSETALLDEGNAIPYHITFRREDLQPGPSRIKRVFIYAVSKGRLAQVHTEWWAGVYNDFLYGQGESTTSTVILGTEQNLKIQVRVDGNIFEAKDVRMTIARTQSLEAAGVEPVRIYEVRFRPSLKGHFAQISIDAVTAEEDISILGYSIEYATAGRSSGSRSNVRIV